MTINIFSNNAKTTLASSITSTQTTITVAPGTGDLFPQPVPGVSIFKVTFVSATDASVYEVCNCTNRTDDTLTVVRGQEGTTATPFSLNDIVGHFDTAGVMSDLVQSEQLQKGYYQFAVATGTANALAAELPSSLTTISNGFRVYLSASAANTGACTLTLTLGSTILTSYPIVKGNNLPLVAGDIPSAGYQMNLVFSSAYNAFALLNPSLAVATAPQFDNSTTVATTAFVQRALGNNQTVVQYSNQSASIASSSAGSIIVCGGTSNTLTLPLASSVPDGVAFEFFNQGGTTDIYPSGSDLLSIGASSSVPYVRLKGNDFVKIAKQASGIWACVSGVPMSPLVGVNQTWTTPSRVFGTTYTNTTLRPIMVLISANVNAGSSAEAYCDEVKIAHVGSGGGTGQIAATMSFIVPSGSTYRAVLSSGSGFAQDWAELS